MKSRLPLKRISLQTDICFRNNIGIATNKGVDIKMELKQTNKKKKSARKTQGRQLKKSEVKCHLNRWKKRHFL